MKQRIILSVIAFSLLTPSAWAQTEKVTRQSSQQTAKPQPAKGKAKSRWKIQGNFHEGLAMVEDANGKRGYIDKTGILVIPCEWKSASWEFREGMAYVRDDRDKYGYIDKTGKLVIPCQWKEAWTFSEGLARVKDDNSKYGFIDKTGKLVIPCKLYNANDFHDGMTLVRDGNFQWCFIDKTGQVVIRTEERQYDQRVILRVKDADGKYGYVDKNGKQVTPYQWKDAGELRSDKTYVQDANGKYGYIDMTGKLIIPCQWSSAKDFLGDYFAHWAAVKDDNGKWGYIDKTGKLVIPCQWEATEGFSEKLAAVKDATGDRYVRKEVKR